MRILDETQLPDRVALHREIEAILSDATGNFPAREIVIDDVEALVLAGRRGDVRTAGERIIAVLSLNLDDLHKGALLSLIARAIGKSKFDPVAIYVLEKRTTYVTSPG
jgi:hypothetical protein